MKSEVTIGKWTWDTADKSSKDGSTQYPRTTLDGWMGVGWCSVVTSTIRPVDDLGGNPCSR